MFKKIVLGFTATLACSTAFADPNWIPVSQTTGALRIEIKAHSMNVTKNDAGLWVATATIRVIKSGNIEFGMVGFALNYCADGTGQIVTFDLGGNVVARNDIVQAGGSAGSQVADAMCVSLKSWLAANKQKPNDTTL
jgi:hypothetical protein